MVRCGLAILFLYSFSLLSAQKKKDVKVLEEHFESSELFQEIFTGFALYDPSKETFLYERAAHKYYTPASNTKLFTLYASLVILGDSIPAFYYQENEDQFTFWGSGNPSFLNSLLPNDSSVVQFLKAQEKPLFFSSHNFQEEHFGSGWAWDDYSGIYQCERSPFPIYGNFVTFKNLSDSVGMRVFPPYFQDKIQINSELPNQRVLLKRALEENDFQCNFAALMDLKYERNIPFEYSDELFIQLLSDTLGRTVLSQAEPLEFLPIQTFYSQVPADSIYQLMMQESDNFIAEQLLLTASNQLFGIQNTKQVIDYITKEYLNDLPDEPIWVDGSGLSRYNLFTPRSIVKLLEKIQNELPQEQLFNIFPAGGVSGTIENWYAAEKGDAPYIFAKTGTLSNKHCLSGFIRTKTDKVLIFSFMNNNYVNGSMEVKAEMQKILEYIRDHF